MIASFDKDGNGEIDFQEFLLMMSSDSGPRDKDEELKEAFRVFDKDGDNTITADEIFAVLEALGEKNLCLEDCKLMVASVDTDDNGAIDFEEFTAMLMDGPARVN